jgi:hypothetical protein
MQLSRHGSLEWSSTGCRVLLESAVARVVSAERLRDIVRSADELADAREEAFYGSEEQSAAELFSREDAGDDLSKARAVETFVAELVERYFRL